MKDILLQQTIESEKRRQLYTAVIVIFSGAMLIAGFRQANAMNSGHFLEGLRNF
jgi:hypothetical protein